MRESANRDPVDVAALTTSPVRCKVAAIPKHVIEELSLQATLVWAEKNAGAYPKNSTLFGAEVAKLYREVFVSLSEPAALSSAQDVSTAAR